MKVWKVDKDGKTICQEEEIQEAEVRILEPYENVYSIDAKWIKEKISDEDITGWINYQLKKGMTVDEAWAELKRKADNNEQLVHPMTAAMSKFINSCQHIGKRVRYHDGQITETVDIIDEDDLSELLDSMFVPDYYRSENGMEVWRIMMEYNLSPVLALALKHILRQGNKPGNDFETDIRKAITYLIYALQWQREHA